MSKSTDCFGLAVIELFKNHKTELAFHAAAVSVFASGFYALTGHHAPMVIGSAVGIGSGIGLGIGKTYTLYRKLKKTGSFDGFDFH